MLTMGFYPLFSQEVLINEFLASNSSIVMDPDFNDFSDWIELYNPGDITVDLGGYFLTDNIENPGKWEFPNGVMMSPGAFMIVWADGRDTILTGYHSNFKLSSGGEEIALHNPSGVVIDSIVFEQQSQDISFGRQPDGAANWYRFDSPSPGLPNSANVYVKTGDPIFSLQAGFYGTDQVLEITNEDTQAEIRYTTNGDEPTASSAIYTEPIPISSREGVSNVHSLIRTNRDPFLWLPDWAPPIGEVFKANVIRARAFRVDSYPSNIITSTYFVDENMAGRYPTIPVISINSDHNHLFDHHTGIYVPGENHQPGNPESGNYFMDWERPAHIEFFEAGGDPGFAQDVGISIQGGTSPASPQKGLHVIARGAYGKNRIEYPIFEMDPSSAKELTEFKRFIIRAWGSLITGSLFNDAYGHRLMAESDLDIQAYRPTVVFINGEYWGLHALREANKNSWYFQYHHGIDRDDPGFDILLHTVRNGIPYADIDEGDDSHWNAMLNYLNSHDMTEKDHYEYLNTQMDMENFIAYMGHCIYVGKWDWPNNNDASWRPRTPDGRWRWIQFDMETGFGVGASLGPDYAALGPQLNMFDATIREVEMPGFGTYGPHPILSKIYNNGDFKEAFIDWFVEGFEHKFHPDSMNLILDEMAAELSPYMQEYQNRWPFIGGVRGSWENSLDQIKEFNNQRQEYVKQHLLELYNTDKIPPVEYMLMQNYPNPFVISTTIRYLLPEAGDVEIRIYNSLGQQVVSYQNQHDSEGQYTLEFDATNRGGGIYYYTFECNGYYEVKKMLLLK